MSNRSEIMSVVEKCRLKGAVTVNIIENNYWHRGEGLSEAKFELWYSLENKQTQIHRGNSILELVAQL